jgi:predicted SnoaL-like aldol condensation-catalyzing enzyme
MTTTAIKQLVTNYITDIWNTGAVESINEYLHPDFKDHTLPPFLPADATGLLQWIALTSSSFKHHTVIEDQVTEGNKSIIKIRMEVVHTGVWRGIAPTGTNAVTTGYRFFRVEAGKIIEQWGHLDGAALEAALTGSAAACKHP